MIQLFTLATVAKILYNGVYVCVEHFSVFVVWFIIPFPNLKKSGEINGLPNIFEQLLVFLRGIYAMLRCLQKKHKYRSVGSFQNFNPLNAIQSNQIK